MLREEHRLRVFGHTALRDVLGLRDRTYQENGEIYNVKNFVVYADQQLLLW